MQMNPMVVVFGKPGAGKSTVADFAIQLLVEQNSNAQQLPGSTSSTRVCPVGLDLDVCVPQWMRDNFAAGIYPTLKQRTEFASSCCDHVEQSLQSEKEKQQVDDPRLLAGVVSFSFVNTDLRDVFRSRFPLATWVLIDTADEEAKLRIEQRKGHFYQGKIEASLSSDETTKAEKEEAPDSPGSDKDNSEWEFAPVTFHHVILNGYDPIEKNAEKVAEILTQGPRSQLSTGASSPTETPHPSPRNAASAHQSPQHTLPDQDLLLLVRAQNPLELLR
jgi:energy-coupling factor transporter ATP-binding protein EcfA2